MSVPVDGGEDTKDLGARNRLEREALSGTRGGRNPARKCRNPVGQRTWRPPPTLSRDGSPRPAPRAPGSKALRPGVHPPAFPGRSSPSHLLPPGAPTFAPRGRSSSPSLRRDSARKRASRSQNRISPRASGEHCSSQEARAPPLRARPRRAPPPPSPAPSGPPAQRRQLGSAAPTLNKISEPYL